jgi:hypothetical protein
MNTYRVLINKSTQNGNLKVIIQARTQNEAQEIAERQYGGKSVGVAPC